MSMSLSLRLSHFFFFSWSGLCKLTSQHAGAAWQSSGTLVQCYKLLNQWCQPGHPHLSIIFWQDEFTCTLTITCWRLCGAGVLQGWRRPGVYWKITSHIFLSGISVQQLRKDTDTHHLMEDLVHDSRAVHNCSCLILLFFILISMKWKIIISVL